MAENIERQFQTPMFDEAQSSLNNGPTLEEIVGFSKRTGFVYPSSEIYGGFSGIYDYGPRGVELINNIKSEWWNEIVRRRKDTVGLDASIFMNPRVWEASGHIENFSDPLAECRVCNTRVRVDHLLEAIHIPADDKMSIEEINQLFDDSRAEIHCPQCNSQDFTEARQFNLLVASNLGNFTGDPSRDPVWLRGETCQGIYVDYRNVVDSSRVKIPFGIAQIGKAFRNEITARQFIFRTREFEQMENQRFVHPDKEMEEYESLKEQRMEYYARRLGLNALSLRWREHDKLAFYANAAWDIEFHYPFGFAELEGVHARGNYDLTQHAKFSGEDLSYFDSATNTRFTPHVIESSTGVGRTALAILSDAYVKEATHEGNERVVLKVHPNLAPVKVAIFPLVRNRSDITAKADAVYQELTSEFSAEWDDNGNTGKRYRRQDEIGTPFTVTVDHQSLEDNTVTIRNRDTMQQVRVNESQVEQFVRDGLRKPYVRL